MKVGLQSLGGWGAGLRLGASPDVVDTAELPDGDASRLGELLTRARGEEEAMPAGTRRLPDGASYVVTVDDGEEACELRCSDGDMTEAFADLLEWLQDKLRQ